LFELAFPPDASERIVLEISAANEKGLIIEAERGVRFELEAAHYIVASGDEYGSTSGSGAGIERFLKRRCILDLAFASGAEIPDVVDRMGRSGGFFRAGSGFCSPRTKTRPDNKGGDQGNKAKCRAVGEGHS